jgi:prophage maintenance system killer protein
MITLEVADLVVIASRILKLDTDRVLDLFDLAAAERALAQAQSASEPADPAGRAAALLHALVREQPLQHGNQQVALVAMLQFLALNGWYVDPDPPGPVATVVEELAADTLDIKNVADWLAPRLWRSDRATTRDKEAPMRPRPVLPLTKRIKKATSRTRRKGMFLRFTDRARRAVVLAQEKARELGHPYIGTEHLLLGLLAEGEGVAALVLESLGISLEEAQGRVEDIVGQGQGAPPRHLPFTPRAKKVLELSLQEALRLGHNYVGTEHLMLSLLREGEGVAVQVLADLSADYAQVRERVLGVLAEVGEQADPRTRLVRLAVPADLADAAEQLDQVRLQKKAAFDTGDLDSAATLRDREKHLRADKLRLEQQWNAGVDIQAVIAENQRVHRELDRLRTLLRQHGIEPDTGTARTA